jgi:hypothetical protein
MFTFCDTILLVSMRTGDTVLDAKCGEVSVEALVLSTPVALDGKDFLLRSHSTWSGTQRRSDEHRICS